jgi:hypothetical protein
MPSLRTEITEIVTGLGTLEFGSMPEALQARPAQLVNVESPQWQRLSDARDLPEYADDFVDAWLNGKAFLEAEDGLRGRTPMAVEWKGPHHPPGYDFLPADLRIDHVFLVSCKYLSRVLANPSPAHLFQRALAIRGGRSEVDWYQSIAEDAYRAFYSEVRSVLAGSVSLPADVDRLSPDDRQAIKSACARQWPGTLAESYRVFSLEVGRRSADLWKLAVPTLADRELLLWRMLRFNPAPYFILGSARGSHLRLRVATPWDWRQKFALLDFEIKPEEVAQPRVGWRAEVENRASAKCTSVVGHVEVRWSHGRFCGFPEAKVYLDTSHHEVPGYFPLN